MTGSAANWRVAGASVQGVSHQKTETPCQDAHRVFVSASGELFAAVADGAGSARYAEKAAYAASLAAFILYQYDLSTLSLASPEDLLPEILQGVREGLLVFAQSHEVEPREFACTLLLVWATAEWVAVIQVGDGAVVIEDSAGNVFALTKPQTGEHANETIFLVSPDALEQAEAVLWRGSVKNIAVFTDGLQRLALKMPEGSAHAPFFAPLFRFMAETKDEAGANAQLETFLRSPRLAERADDDLTLLLAHRISPDRSEFRPNADFSD